MLISMHKFIIFNKCFKKSIDKKRWMMQVLSINIQITNRSIFFSGSFYSIAFWINMWQPSWSRWSSEPWKKNILIYLTTITLSRLHEQQSFWIWLWLSSLSIPNLHNVQVATLQNLHVQKKTFLIQYWKCLIFYINLHEVVFV